MKITKMTKGSWGKIIAFFDIETEDGFTIKGFKIVEGSDGKFVGFPSREKDGEYYDTVYASKELKEELRKLAMMELDNPSESQVVPETPLEEIPF